MKSMFLMLCLTFNFTAKADVLDRINACENQGGGSCVFDLLRELASRGGGGHERHGIIKSGIYKKDASGATVTLSCSDFLSFTAQGFGNSQWDGVYKCGGTRCSNQNDGSKYFMVQSNEVVLESGSESWTLIK